MHRTVAVLLAVGVVLVPAGSASAADCAPPRSPGAQAAAADAIFQGTVTTAKPLRSGKLLAVTLVVERSWKGRPPSVAVVRVPTRRCPLVLEVGRRYTVFADVAGDVFTADARSGTIAGTISPGRYDLLPPPQQEAFSREVPNMDVPGWLWLTPIAFILMVVGGVFVSWWRKEQRRKQLAFIATQQGLAYSAFDPFTGIDTEPFSLFSKGDGRGWENFITGTWQGLEVAECDYWYYEETKDGRGGKSRTYYRFSCLMLPVDGACPQLRISREGALSRLADHLGFKDIQFELEEFNRAFQVQCTDKRFAVALVDQRMMQHLLRDGGGWSYEVVGNRALVFSDRLQPSRVVMLLGTAKAFADHIPRVVSSLYAPGERR